MPFLSAYFQYGFPIYSSKAVRFKMGYAKCVKELHPEVTDNSVTVDNFIWTYTSPEFPVVQVSSMSKIICLIFCFRGGEGLSRMSLLVMALF